MKCVGVKQVLKSIKENKVKKVYVAKDAEGHITEEIINISSEKNIPIVYVETMTELGKMSGIDVGASCMAE